MKLKFTSLAVAVAAFVSFAVPAARADATFTLDVAPRVGQTSTVDASAVVPTGASVTTSVQWRSPGCCGATHILVQLGRTPVTTWTPTAGDAMHAYVIIVVDVGVLNPANHLVRHTVYAQSYIVGQPVVDAPVAP